MVVALRDRLARSVSIDRADLELLEVPPELHAASIWFRVAGTDDRTGLRRCLRRALPGSELSPCRGPPTGNKTGGTDRRRSERRGPPRRPPPTLYYEEFCSPGAEMPRPNLET